MEGWWANSLRLSVFSTEEMSLSDDDWKQVTGEGTEAEVRQNLPGGRRYIGKFQNGQLVVTVVGRRVDLILSSIVNLEQGQLNAPAIGKWQESVPMFVDQTSAWLQSLRSPVHRLAFGAVALAAANDREMAYDRLKQMLRSVNVDPARMRDFLFRVNWRADSKAVEGLSLNRLTTFSALKIQMSIRDSAQSFGETARGPESHYVQLDMDHNTDDAHTHPFDGHDLVPIYQELVSLASGNVEVGEVR